MTWIVGFVLLESSDKTLALGRPSAVVCLVVGILGESGGVALSRNELFALRPPIPTITIRGNPGITPN